MWCGAQQPPPVAGAGPGPGPGHAGHAGHADAGHAVPQPVTPPDLVPRVDPGRRVAGGREFTWPAQPGPLAPRDPQGLLGPAVSPRHLAAMQEDMEAVLRLVVMTDHHLEAALGRNHGNTLCAFPGMIGHAMAKMSDVFKDH